MARTRLLGVPPYMRYTDTMGQKTKTWVSDCFGFVPLRDSQQHCPFKCTRRSWIERSSRRTTSDGMATGLVMIHDFLSGRRWPFRSSHLAIASLNNTDGCVNQGSLQPAAMDDSL